MAKEFIALGAENYIVKSIDKEELLETIKRSLKKIDANQNSRNDSPLEKLAPAYSPHVQEAIELIHQNFSEDLNLKDIAEQLHLSAVYLGQKFKKEVGKNFAQYLNEYRIEKAQILLMSTSLPVNEIAIEIGYGNTGYFYKNFKRLCGISPKEYRQQFRS